MSRKKLAGLAVSLGLVSVIGVGATLAYFTDQASTANVITMGHVDIDLTEHQVVKNEDGKWVKDETVPVTSSGLQFTDVFPGETVEKDPTVTITEDSGDAYVRVKMDIVYDGSTFTAADMEALQSNIDSEINASGDWYKGADGYYYYNTALTQDAPSAVLFDTVTLPGSAWKNNTASQSFSIQLQAEAIQSAYFEPTTDGNGMITGWVDENNQPITAETYSAE